VNDDWGARGRVAVKGATRREAADDVDIGNSASERSRVDGDIIITGAENGMLPPLVAAKVAF
jgi:hypothetical protein